MQIGTQEKELLTLIVLGGTIGLGKLLAGNMRLTPRAILGQVIVGAGLATSAGAALLMFNDMPPTALVGVAALIGFGGQSTLETAIRRHLERRSAEPHSD